MLLLMTFLEKPSDNGSLRTYQRDRWGRVSGGETCVIELSGLAAKSSSVPVDRMPFLQERIEIIRQRIRTYKPKFVIMYGANEGKHWEQIAGRTLDRESIVKPDLTDLTFVAFTSHPVSHGRRNSDWKKLGERLREKSGPS